MSENVDEFLGVGADSNESGRDQTGEDNLEFAKSCVERSVVDAKRLYKVASRIYVVLIGLNWFVGVCGTLLGVGLFFIAQSAMAAGGAIVLAGFKVWAGTAIFCAINYGAAALLTSKAKVLANISATLVKPNS